MSVFYINRCSICGSRIPRGQKLCDICESEYPCNKCTNKVKTVCMCKQWKRWFHLQWEHLHRPKQKNHENAPFDNKIPENNNKSPLNDNRGLDM